MSSRRARVAHYHRDVPIRYELFATGPVPPDELWALVGDPRRLPEWTDAVDVPEVTPEPVTEGSRIVVDQAGGERSVWTVTTAEDGLLEATTETPRGTVGIGVRVTGHTDGARLVLAGFHSRGGLRVRLLDAPALRRRFDRWAETALRAAVGREP